MDDMNLAVTTHVFGLGGERAAPPTYIPLHERETTARRLVGDHVRAELARAREARSGSLALHYLLSDELHRQPAPEAAPHDEPAEVARACEAIAARRAMLFVDGEPVHDLDAPLTLTQRSAVSFVRLVPLIGG